MVIDGIYNHNCDFCYEYYLDYIHCRDYYICYTMLCYDSDFYYAAFWCYYIMMVQYAMTFYYTVLRYENDDGESSVLSRLYMLP